MSKKKIILITDDFIHNSQKSGAFLMKDLAIAINKSKYFSSIVLAPDINSKLISKVKVAGIETILFPSGKLKNINSVRRAFNEYMLSRRVKKCFSFIENEDVSAIVYYSPSIFFGNAVKFFKNKFNCLSYLILRDLFPQWLVDIGLIKKNDIFHLVFKYFENINYLNADKIGVMSESNRKLFSSRSDFEKFEVLYSWQTPIKIHKNENILKKRNLEFLKDKFVFFYGGNIGLAQDIDILLSLAHSLLNSKNIHFVFIGQGDSVSLITDKALSNVTHINSMPEYDYFELAMNFHVGFFSLHKDHTAHNYPGKIWGYMSLNKPIIGIVNKGNDVKELINLNNAGLVCSHDEDVEKLTKHCLDLYENNELLNTQGINSSKIILKFSPENTANQILNSLNLVK
tara:strand:+ start:2457 stop:3653 length:1197 start_codon:yes stop_codon:yes gene_type:complete